MKYLARLLPVITAVFLVILFLLIAWQCVDIYFFSPSATEIIYTYENIAARLNRILPFVAVCVLLILLTYLFSPPRKSAQPATRRVCNHKSTCSQSCKKGRTCLLIRLIFLMFSIGFIIWGVLNGGLYDVLVKAINICTECIGLG